MPWYNLLGQKGPKGETNPDAPEAGPYIYWNEPPGVGDNKGLITTSYTDRKTGQGSLGPADRDSHKSKLEEAGIEPEDDYSFTASFTPKDKVKVKKDFKFNLTRSERDNIKTLGDISELSSTTNFSNTDINTLKGRFGWTDSQINNALEGKIEETKKDVGTVEDRRSINQELAESMMGGELDITGLDKVLSDINKQMRGYDSLTEYMTERPEDIKRFIKDTKKKQIDIKPPEGTQEGFVLRIDKDGELEGFDERTGNIFNPRTLEVLDNEYFSEPILPPEDGESLGGALKPPPKGEEKPPPPLTGGEQEGEEQPPPPVDGTSDVVDRTQVPTNTEQIDLNNIPVGAQVWDVDGTLYLAYAVPGAGDLYTGSTIWMAYDVVGNDLFEAGLLTEGFNYTGPNMPVTKEWFDKTAIIGGNTNQLIGIEDDPFASFVETYKEEAALRPWLLDNDFIELQAEAALENRDISPTEWQSTTWYQTNNQAKRDWMDIELSDPAEAKRKRDDLELYFKNQLQGLGVAGVPDGLVQWVTNKNITGEWSDLKTAEQLQLFADPFKSGYRDEELLNLISTSGFGDVDRTAAREREVVELYRKWLGPSLGALTQDEVANIAGRMRDDPDYEDALINSLKQSRLAAFSNYTNPELTYEDIARPWRNLTTSVWGQNADETQGWWQEMVKSNDYTTAQATLRERGLENNIAQVNIEATEALQQALGQGSISQSGVNV